MLPYFTLLFIQIGDEINCYFYIAPTQTCNLWSLYRSVLIVLLLLLLLVHYTQGNISLFNLIITE